MHCKDSTFPKILWSTPCKDPLLESILTYFTSFPFPKFIICNLEKRFCTHDRQLYELFEDLWMNVIRATMQMQWSFLYVCRLLLGRSILFGLSLENWHNFRCKGLQVDFNFSTNWRNGFSIYFASILVIGLSYWCKAAFRSRTLQTPWK